MWPTQPTPVVAHLSLHVRRRISDDCPFIDCSFIDCSCREGQTMDAGDEEDTNETNETVNSTNEAANSKPDSDVNWKGLEWCFVGCTVAVVILALLFICALACAIGFGIAWGELRNNTMS